MNRRSFLRSVAIAVASTYLQLAPERSVAFQKLAAAASKYASSWLLVGSKVAAQLGLPVELKGVALIGELNGVKVYHDPFLPENELLLGYKTMG